MKKEFHKCHVPLITAYRQMQENEALKEMPQAKPLIEGFVTKCHYIAISGAFACCMDARHNVYMYLRILEIGGKHHYFYEETSALSSSQIVYCHSWTYQVSDLNHFSPAARDVINTAARYGIDSARLPRYLWLVEDLNKIKNAAALTQFKFIRSTFIYNVKIEGIPTANT
uniref:Uncharacterized protein n=1 Tax=Glossina pallidipes TaxID=7398 RepID=A0A1B0AH59_GLOPL